ncbi:efflux RND transporter permease subunit [Ferrimonas lipolytica]|uniref:Efflux RND transporter permease subunit n=1 Tax=Ferrimonas lipolytica TaxID=2724191 RepID=A0A6H1UGK2_9GAMM|nr:efflux RND transporter permease subunit [Ferrimonas lipolytica]QIZ76922.1 efflux RND transporter permease subunit [Ferrimonas lipolytica]
MNFATLTINKRFFASFLTTLLCILGIYGYFALGKLEDPTFTVKTAAIVTLYPGASAEEVEERVTDVLERKIEEMGNLWKLRSVSRPGQSMVFVHLYDTVPLPELQQNWDLLRRKVSDVQMELPLEAKAHVVIDEFSEVYGMLFALRGEGVPKREMNHYARMLQRDLKAVAGVNKVIAHGLYERNIIIEIDEAKLAKINLTPVQLFDQLQSQNLVSHPGDFTSGIERIRIGNQDTLDSVEAVGDLILRGGAGELGNDRFRLADVANVYEDDSETPLLQTRFNGHSTITVAVNPQDGINVVAIGDTIKQAIADFEAKVPAGIVVDAIVFQPDEVNKSVSDFTGNLISSVAIVVIVLWIFMGWRSASIVGGSLAITLLMTLVYMLVTDINLHRVSVGTFILALGMLVDNAIVVTDLFIAKLRTGMERGKAAADSVSETAVPLLAATLIAIAATTPVLFSVTAAAEFAIDLPIIMFASLMLSWIVAMTITPLMCWQFYKLDPNGETEPKWMGLARRVVTWIVINRKKALTVIFIAISLTCVASTKVLLNFMPGSDRPITFVDYWLPQGGNVQQTAADMKQIEAWLMVQPEVESVASFIGGGAPRFSMTYEPEPNDPSYGQLLVNLESYEQIPELRRRGDAWLKANFPKADPRFRPLKLATQDKFNIEARFLGPDPQVLKQLADQAKEIIAAHPNTKYIRDDWRQSSKVLVPQFNQDRARLAGVTRNDVNRALARATDGLTVASIYDGRDRLPVKIRLEEAQRNDFSALMNLPVTPALGNQSVPMSQVVDGFELQHEPGQIWRYYRHRTMSVQADVEGQYASLVRNDLAAEVEAIELPAGYRFEWGGEYYDEQRTVLDVITQVPKSGLVMLLLMVAMFNGIKQPLAIILTIPLAIMGIVPMLLISSQPFGFMALVGVISLTGMVIKNGIVLMDQINLEIGNGRSAFDAIIESAVNRTLAISMAALTTVLGMVPLWWDPLFGPMAVTIIGGLSVATFLTLLIMPVFYAILFRVETPKERIDA